MDVSEHSGTPKSSLFNRVFHYKPSILGYPIFGNTHITHKEDSQGAGPGEWLEVVRQRYSTVGPGKEMFLVRDSEKIYKFNTDLINSQSYNYSW